MPSEDVAATQALIGGDPFEKEVMHARDQRSRRLENAWNATIILATFALTAAAVTDSFSPRGLRASSSSTAEELSVDHSKEYSITLEGSYNADYPDSTKPTGYDAVVKDAKMIVEPHYDYKLKVVGTHFFDNCDFEGTYLTGGGVWDDTKGLAPASRWSPRGKAEAIASKSHEVMISFPAPGSYEVKIKCEFQTGHLTTLTNTFHAYYIRRELRELNTRDRKDFLDTFITMSKTPTAEGIKLYGKQYRSLADFEVMHLRAAGARRVDHIHDGLGGVTQHAAMTMEFELAMQSVQPRLAVPYWDYTIDSIKVEFDAGRAQISSIFKDSELFAEDFFGETDSDAHRVTVGRFAQLLVPRNDEFEVKSPYGFLRAPWNINPSKFVTRYHKVCDSDVISTNSTESTAMTDLMWPTCASHFQFSNTDEAGLDTWRTWADMVMYKPHGPVHSWVGGVGGQCNTFDALHTQENLLTLEQTDVLKHVAFALLKSAWRSELLNTPSYCAADAPVSECMWQCSDDIFVGGSDQNKAAMTYLSSFAGLQLNTILASEKDRHKVLRKVFCDTPYWPGDHLEAASPVEASFWAIHPTLDRLFQYKQLVRPFADKTWESTSGDSDCVASESGCEGHHAYDATYFKAVMVNKDGIFQSKHMTNIEMRDAMDPRETYALPYFYNHFDWSHCSKAGIEFKKVEHSQKFLLEV